jgi:uncharacterized protein YoaH (UPF0181 family)
LQTTTRPQADHLGRNETTMSTAQEKIEALANSLGVSSAEAVIFLACIAFWMDKGLSMQEAIKAHAKTMKEGCAIALGKI